MEWKKHVIHRYATSQGAQWKKPNVVEVRCELRETWNGRSMLFTDKYLTAQEGPMERDQKLYLLWMESRSKLNIMNALCTQVAR
jgi:hypothetical protein